MTLLQEIQQAALDSSVDIADLLRKCKVLAARLKHKEFAEWVNRELNGYSDAADLPEYRKVSVQSLGHFSGPFGSGIRNAPIPVTLLPDELRHLANQQVFLESVGTLSAHISSDRSSTFEGRWTADLVAYVQQYHPIYEDMILVSAWRMIPGAVISGILDTIRTRILDFALAIEEQEPSAGESEPGQQPRIAAEKVSTIYHTVIHSGQANIGTLGDAQIRTGDIHFSDAIPEAVRSELKKLLSELYRELESVDRPDDRKEAHRALVKVEEQLASSEPRLDRMKKYLELYTTIVSVSRRTAELITDILTGLFGG